jgi:hypothetical protein
MAALRAEWPWRVGSALAALARTEVWTLEHKHDHSGSDYNDRDDREDAHPQFAYPAVDDASGSSLALRSRGAVRASIGLGGSAMRGPIFAGVAGVGEAE